MVSVFILFLSCVSVKQWTSKNSMVSKVLSRNTRCIKQKEGVEGEVEGFFKTFLYPIANFTVGIVVLGVLLQDCHNREVGSL